MRLEPPPRLLALALGFFLTLSPAAAIDEESSRPAAPAGPTRVPLERTDPRGKVKIRYSRRHTVVLTGEDPGPGENHGRRYRGEFPLDARAGGPLPFVLRRSKAESPCPDEIVLDLDRNGTYDAKDTVLSLPTRYQEERKQHYGRARIEVPLVFSPDAAQKKPHGRVESTRLFSLITLANEAGEVYNCRIHRSSWREGTATFGSRRIRVVLIDDDNDGMFERTSGDSWSLGDEETPVRELLAASRVQAASDPLPLGTDRVRIATVDPAGRFVTVEPVTGK